MSDPLAGFCRLLDPTDVDPTWGYVGDFLVTFPILSPPPGDGFIQEWDWVIAIPGRSDIACAFALWDSDWTAAGSAPPNMPQATEWTFDSRTPPAWVSWATRLITPTSLLGWVSFTDAATYDSNWDTGYDLGFAFSADAGSDPAWYFPPPRVRASLVDAGSESRIRAFNMRWQQVKSDVGSGSVDLGNDDADAAGAAYGDVVKFSLDDTPRFSILVEQKQRLIVSPDEESAEITTLSGRGTVAVYERAVVAPVSGVGPGQTSTVRAFNFANPLIDLTGWTANGLVSGPRSQPEGWPDPLTEWCWSQDPLTLPVPAGDIYLRKYFPVATDTIAEVWCAADDGYEIWLDGDKLFEDTLDTAWTGVAKNQRVFLRASYTDGGGFPPGWHSLSIHARNNNALLAGVFACVILKDATDSITDVACRTQGGGSSGWWVLPYPSSPPGFTPGKVMLILLDEAIARGSAFVASNNYNTYDSARTGVRDWAGVTWPVVSDITVQVGQDLLTVLKQLAETYLDFGVDYNWVGYGGYGDLQLFVDQGATQAAVLAKAVNLRSLEADGRV